MAVNVRICLRQMTVDETSNETPAVPALLKLMKLSGGTVTLLQQDPSLKENIRGKRLRAGGDETVLIAIYQGFSSP